MQIRHMFPIFLLLCLIITQTAKASPGNGNDTLKLDVQALSEGKITLSSNGKKMKESSDSLHVIGKNLPIYIYGHGNKFKVLLMNLSGNAKPNIIDITKDTVSAIINPSAPAAGSILLDNTFKLVVQPADGNPVTFEELTLNPDPSTQPAAAKPATDKAGDIAPGDPFIDATMLNSVSGNADCIGCNMSALIEKKKYRTYSTDFFVYFDYERKRDDYTICKHIFKDTTVNGKSILVERYRKVKPSLFAPPVGSQVKFEVVNFHLTDKLNISVGDSDLFLNNSNFQNVLNTQYSGTILKNAQTASQAAPAANPAAPAAQGNLGQEDDTMLLKRLSAELNDYVNAFVVSGCTIVANRANLTLLRGRIKTQFKLASFANITDQLSDKFKNTSQAPLADAIGITINQLDSIRQPLVYSTARLRNRDYINIKVTNNSNQVVVDENIRTSFGLKIDFSGGLFITGLRDYNYIFKDTSLKYTPVDTLPARDTSGRIIVREVDSKINLGFGFLAHVYPRISSDYNLGLACGFMSTTNLNLNILLGGSLLLQSLFGANTRVAFTGGAVFGKVNRLSHSAYEGLHIVNNSPVFYPTSLNAPPTTAVWSTSWFFGMTYNFN